MKRTPVSRRVPERERESKNIFNKRILILLIAVVLAILIFLFKSSPPQILSASVYPEKITAGQAMQIKAEIKDSLLIKNVKASIETDDLPDAVRLLLVDGTIRNGKYERVWIAHDTSAQKWYNITITATNLLGKTATKIISYQDPTQSHNASEIVGGTFTGNYSFAGGDINIGGNLNVSGNFSTDTPRFKVGSFTRDISLASGTQAITGVGFTPKVVMLFATVNDAVGRMSVGFSDVATDVGVFDNYGRVANTYEEGGQIVTMMVDAVTYYLGTITSLDTDGFTVTWSKIGSPTGTATIIYLTFR